MADFAGAKVSARVFDERSFWFAAQEVAKSDQAARFIESGVLWIQAVGNRLGLRKSTRAKLASLRVGHTEDATLLAWTRRGPFLDQSGM